MLLPIPDLRFENTFLKSLEKYKTEDDEIPKDPVSITPSIVIYCVVKDQVLMPLIQGLVWTGLFIVCKPALNAVVRHGVKMGSYLKVMVGVGVGPRSRL